MVVAGVRNTRVDRTLPINGDKLRNLGIHELQELSSQAKLALIPKSLNSHLLNPIRFIRAKEISIRAADAVLFHPVSQRVGMKLEDAGRTFGALDDPVSLL